MLAIIEAALPYVISIGSVASIGSMYAYIGHKVEYKTAKSAVHESSARSSTSFGKRRPTWWANDIKFTRTCSVTIPMR